MILPTSGKLQVQGADAGRGGAMPVATGRGGPPAGEPGPGAGPDLAAITRAASREAGGISPDLLGDYLPAVLEAARTGRRLTPPELAGYGRSGEQAAENGVALRGLVDLYLSATWRLWRELPADDSGPGLRAARAAGTMRAAGGTSVLREAGLAVLRAADDAVAAAAEGFERAHLSIARRQEAERIEFLDDLLGGRGSLAELVARGARLGLRLAGRHQVVLAQGSAGARYSGPQGLVVERLIASAVAPAPSLTMIRSGRLVAVIGDGGEADHAAEALARELSGKGEQAASGRPGWRVAVGRPYTGPAGVMRSYEEATDALDVAERLALPDPVVRAGDLLMYRVILRDRTALADLVTGLLLPLSDARDGAGPLLETLEAYFASGQVAAQAARRLHLSVRAVTYRLARVKALTGKDPADPEEALGLQLAVIGARLLDWPDTPLDAS
jgi:sugar diacid utilization regulator